MGSTSKKVASWRLTALVASGLACLVRASPSVNVALQASFDAPPYLIELLETAAEENSTSYFPLLDRVADGAFEDAVTDKEIYDRFLQVVDEDGHLKTTESRSSFKLSLAIRSASPRITAHYQYYNASVQHSLMAAQDAACPVWVHSQGKQYCSSTLERAQQDVLGDMNSRELPFDRVLGDISLPPAILYADVASPMFRDFHHTLSALAKQGQVSYRVRYRPPQHSSPRPLFVSGYGVELALKRTDYIVIDDRAAEQQDSNNVEPGDGDAPDDLRPLSSSEVARLGVNAVSYVMDSENPLDTLVKLSQDFPKYSAKVAAHNATTELLEDIRSTRLQMLPAGVNVMWINGVQIDSRQIDAFSLLEHLRRERRLVEKFRDIGVSAQEAVSLLSHEFLGEALAQEAPQRYDYQDDIEGGRVLIWLNDLEKDARYQSWPEELQALLQRTYPGQLPAVRRNANNIVVPVDLSSLEDLNFVVRTMQAFVQKGIPARFAIVPMASSAGQKSQVKVAHYLQETYGLASLIHYLDESFEKNKAASADKGCFETATKERQIRSGKKALSFDEVLKSGDFENVVSQTVHYQDRLGITPDAPQSFINGAPVPRKSKWMQEVSVRISGDLQELQQGIADGAIEESTSLPGVFLSKAFSRRSQWVIPEDPKDIRVVDVAKVADSQKDVLSETPLVASTNGDALDSAYLIAIGDFDSESGFQLLTAVLEHREQHNEVEVLFVHNSENPASAKGGSTTLYRSIKTGKQVEPAQILANIGSTAISPPSNEEAEEISQFWARQQSLVRELGFPTGANGLVINGRAIGPIQHDVTSDDLDQLLTYEQEKRIGPVARACKNLGFGSNIPGPLAFAKLTSLTTLSTVSDVPEGIFESTSDIRINLFDKWNNSRSVLTVSNSEDPAITILASIDPSSETAQRWLPILKVLSELASVRVRLFLNPHEHIKELPTKRFYRYVLDSEPSFNNKGSISRPTASFRGVPVEALLTLGMDVPSSWLVAPQDSIHDLDNIKLSSLNSDSDVEAVYALEHILIEGHSRDLTTKSPPRGVQLNIGTDNNPSYADTIIMANLGYFQFKTQPGLWKINLKPGSSERIFNLDSVGGLGYSPQPGDDNNEVALLSFQGKTLFPRLSRKKGYEMEDVLETGPKAGTAMDYVSKGFGFASSVLSSVGVGSGGLSQKQADINIFSVASGHLYERMLNIMMVSVMKNTKHTVKFWFIEQFLSPSFKSFLPHLAAEHGFQYEMVTFKWPHWLRAQREKQREIWGYKILFLDVLFPLNLDKVIFVDADQVVRTDMYDLVTLDLEGAPYGFTPMCDSREEIEGFRFWKQGYWKGFLRGQPYHISALYVVDLNRFRELAAGDRLRGQYQMLSADPNSLSNLDQDLPNHMQHQIPIKSLPQDWLWCETWCSDESLGQARTIDLCNNPQTKEPKLDRAKRQVPEWTEYDDEIAALAKRVDLDREQKEQELRAELQEDDEDSDDVDEDEPSAWKKDEL
ncbi:putative UDP-glucose:glycoprotein glucosyltransferase [Aspergillus affinis]|uniref:putative UDP-glucose:glycoprotein glucosyltransferase n=1 Tax=Aspergillus affinis TaxID=1070780 RepID=UPI0022FF0A80|nr:glucosyltransferase [Aspergillus affinis]KAI9041154.1 glucosyltransferase [Aspergillus affinis]